MAPRDVVQVVRPWREIAAELAVETDTATFLRLAEELAEALRKVETLEKKEGELPPPGSMSQRSLDKS